MTTVTLTSVNIGVLEKLSPASKSRTGIRKTPVGGGILCDSLGLLGDAIGNHKHHGGPDQAVYLYSAADYAWWSKQLGVECSAGHFGENLTIDHWWDTPRAGDRLQFGDVILELTAPRIPCSTLAARMGDPRFVDTFANAVRPGAYARVVQPGTLTAGTCGTVTHGDASWRSINELFSLWLNPRASREALLDTLRAPVGIRLRERFLQRLSSAP